MSELPTETVSRLLNEQAALRAAIDTNADLYRRDVQYALDLMTDIQAGSAVNWAKAELEEAHARGRQELRDWRIGLEND